MTASTPLLASALTGTLILMCGFAGAAVLRKCSAAVRHGMWVATLGALLVLPIFLAMAPTWHVVAPAPVFWVEPLPVDVTVSASPGQPAQPISWPLRFWLLGAVSAAGWFVAGAVRISRMARRSVPAPPVSELDVRVREGSEIPVPMVWGIWRPVVLLPLAARDWPAERLRSTLVHEATHIRRGDLVVQLMAQAVCSLYWFHPLVWLAARELRKERERACDDAVLRGGIAAPEYAGHLMEMARTMAGHRLHAPAMAESSDLEGRVRALLDRRRNREPLRPKVAVGIACGVLALLLPMVVLQAEARRAVPPPLATTPPVAAEPSSEPSPRVTPPVQTRPVARPPLRRLLAQVPSGGRSPQPENSFVSTQVPAVSGPISGIVFDPSGARVPGCHVIARSLDGSAVMGVVTGPTGAYKFDSLPPGRYLLQFDVPGFKSSLMMANSEPQYVWLSLGSTNETVTVGAPKPAVVGVAPQPGPQRLRVGGNVQPARLLSQVRPVYPPELQQLGIEGSVLIRAIISKTGEPTSLQVINTGIDPRLAQAAMDSVSQWRYQPTLLNGEPVAVETTVTVDFMLQPQ